MDIQGLRPEELEKHADHCFSDADAARKLAKRLDDASTSEHGEWQVALKKAASQQDVVPAVLAGQFLDVCSQEERKATLGRVAWLRDWITDFAPLAPWAHEWREELERRVRETESEKHRRLWVLLMGVAVGRLEESMPDDLLRELEAALLAAPRERYFLSEFCEAMRGLPESDQERIIFRGDTVDWRYVPAAPTARVMQECAREQVSAKHADYSRLKTFRAFGEAAVPFMVEGLKEAHGDGATILVKAIGELARREQLEALTAALGSRQSRVRDAAVEELAEVDLETQAAHLSAALQAGRKASREAAIRVLETMPASALRGRLAATALKNERTGDLQARLEALAGEQGGPAPLEKIDEIAAELGPDRLGSLFETLDSPAEREGWRGLAGELGDDAYFLAVASEYLRSRAARGDSAYPILDWWGEILDAFETEELAPWAAARVQAVQADYVKSFESFWRKFAGRTLEPARHFLGHTDSEWLMGYRAFAESVVEYGEAEDLKLLVPGLASEKHDLYWACRRPLHGHVDLVLPHLEDLLTGGKAKGRIHVLEYLQSEKSGEALPILRARLDSERSKKARAALLRTIEVCGSDEELAKDVLELDGKGLNARIPEVDPSLMPDWLPLENIALHWEDGELVSPSALRWLIHALTREPHERNKALEGICLRLDEEEKATLWALLRNHAREISHEKRRRTALRWTMRAAPLLADGEQLDEIGRTGDRQLLGLGALEDDASGTSIGWLEYWAHHAISPASKRFAANALRRIAEKRGVAVAKLVEMALTENGAHERIAKTLVARFEDAMIEGTPWSLERWKHLFESHPVARQLGSGLVFEQRGASVYRFFISSEGETLGLDHERVEVRGEVVIPHPLSFRDELAEWRETLSDTDLEQPFEQLERAIYVPDEAGRKEMFAWVDGEASVSKRRMAQGLREHGFTHGPIDSEGMVYSVVRSMRGWQVTIEHSGWRIGQLSEVDAVSLQRIVLSDGDKSYLPEGLEQASGIGVPFSETMRFLAALHGER